MKPTFRPVVYAHHKRKDGTYNVKINIYFNGKERRLPTNLYCSSGDLTRTLHIKSNDILCKCNVQISKMQKAISEISTFEMEGKDVDWLVAKIKAKLTAQSFRLDFFEWAEEYMKTEIPVASTRRTYVSAINAFAEYNGKRELDINLITRKMIQDFEVWISNRGKTNYNKHRGAAKVTTKKKKNNAASMLYISKLAAIHRAAKKKYNDEDEGLVLIPRSPFDNLDLVVPVCEGQKPLSQELIQKIILDKPVKQKQRVALDVVVVSFALQGVNFADLYSAKPFKGDVWKYRRQKTGVPMEQVIPECVKPFLARLGAGTSKEWWLPVLHENDCTKGVALNRTNLRLKAWCAANGIDTFATYAVRKSWATLARKYEDKAIADEAIGHSGGNRMLDIYAEKPYERYHDLNEKVLALFEWE